MSRKPEPRPPLKASGQGIGPARWLGFFGPGAIIASLTIGSGELIFSSRAGALFGYRLLWFFVLVLAVKWILVFAAARHIVLSGAHPIERWMELPGPRGWLPLVLLLLAIPSFPIWVGFHAGTVGTLMARLTSTGEWLGGGAHFLWGIVILAMLMGVMRAGGYKLLERTQIVVVLLMLGCVTFSLFLIRPDWAKFLEGFVSPGALQYPDWARSLAEFQNRPVWLEMITYVGVIGGSAYDYLAYVSYLRDKHWGQSSQGILGRVQLDHVARDAMHPNRKWLRAPMLDCTLSFLAVLVFSAVFVACGAEILGPRHKVPSGGELLTLQADFVTPLYPWLRHVYFAGAFLTMLGTLYGTMEVAPAVLREIIRARARTYGMQAETSLRRRALGWVAAGGALALLASLTYTWLGGEKGNPPALVAILTPANLFTGVLACGIVLLLNVWMDLKFLPRAIRMNPVLLSSSLVGGLCLVVLGVKGYWDHSRWAALGILSGTVAAGMLLAVVFRVRPKPGNQWEDKGT